MKTYLKSAAVIGLSTAFIFSAAAVDSKKGEPGPPDHANGKGPGPNTEEVENIIFMIPDGFSASYATNYRIYKEGEEPVWDDMLTGMIKTDSANNYVTDSAAAGTAMATGEKTNNDMISMTPGGEPLESILQKAGDEGKATGLVATSTITHATPAVFGASVEARDNETAIAPQLLNNVDVLLGGGRDNFLPENQGGNQKNDNLIEKAEQDGFEYIKTKEELEKAESEKLLGLFAEDAMAPDMERPKEQPSLADMTEGAIDNLEQDDDGFFLMVEGSQIDWAGHAHDAAWAMSETEAFEKAVKEAVEFAEEDGETLVVIAGDHETGGMSVGGNDEYKANPEILRNVTATGDTMAEALNNDRSNAADVLKEYAGISPSEEEIARIQAAEDPAFAMNTIVSEHAYVGWTTDAHTGTDVQLYAYGPSSDLFHGLLDNTDLPKKMAEAMDIEWEK
ncbi:alkaline phosphatase [Alteribacillus persepolensis]|uniref:Alkaline phosphatase n=1 Tax=Alteribacillus persepolensis TaxID=568899 RepID=A0A1G8GTL2_9BACI|nr:alkaline phosphatase [Alteribacillus persepolensis]SDH97621.1 alkaline phosphatase [Alteribacillus persepolensis]